MTTINGINVRFFVHQIAFESEDPIVEVSEERFMRECDMGARVEYDRHTVFEHGVSQICLTAWQE